MQVNTIFEAWLHASGITRDVAETFDISYTDRIIFPVHDQEGVFIFNKYRRSPLTEVGPKYTYDIGGRISLYGWHQASKSDSILITEGEKDCLVAWSRNIPAVTSTGGALSFQSEWGDLLYGKDITILLDNDQAGGEGTARILGIIPHAKVAFIPDMPNVKDIADYLNAGGDLRELLRTSRTFNDMAEVREDRARRIALFQSVHFHDAYVKRHTKAPVYVGPKRSSFSSDVVARAREYPIPELIEFNQFGKRICPFHKEDSPSLAYYPKTNSAYCFGMCGRAYDAIDVYRHIHNCSFTQAVKSLNNL